MANTEYFVCENEIQFRGQNPELADGAKSCEEIWIKGIIYR
jgi:hypothetical protein